MRNFATPTLSYVGAVLGVIAVATFAVFNLRGIAATGYRHWDADIDRIIARQQEKKYRLDGAALANMETPGVASDVGPIALLGSGTIEDESAAKPRDEEAGAQKSRAEGARKGIRRAEHKRQQYIPAAFAAVPKIATTTTTLLGLR